MKSLFIAQILVLSIGLRVTAQHVHDVPSTDSLSGQTSKNAPGIDSRQTQPKSAAMSHHDHAHMAARSNHFMAMGSFGMSSDPGTITSFGIGYEHRLPMPMQSLGIGATAMAMITGTGSMVMLSGTGTMHLDDELFLQLEIGSAHADRASPAQSGKSHEMALLGGLGIGCHVPAAGISLAPMLEVDYTRLKKPTYYLTMCVGM